MANHRKYANKEEYLAASRERSKERYYNEKRELTPIRVERPSRRPVELAKREQLKREIAEIRNPFA